MDQLFLEIVLVLIGGTLDESCPSPSPHNVILGITISRRKINTRIEIWLGGREAPEHRWVQGVEQALRTLTGEKVYGYKSFGVVKGKA